MHWCWSVGNSCWSPTEFLFKVYVFLELDSEENNKENKCEFTHYTIHVWVIKKSPLVQRVEDNIYMMVVSPLMLVVLITPPILSCHSVSVRAHSSWDNVLATPPSWFGGERLFHFFLNSSNASTQFWIYIGSAAWALICLSRNECTSLNLAAFPFSVQAWEWEGTIYAQPLSFAPS